MKLDLVAWADRVHNVYEVVGAIATALAVIVALAGLLVELRARRRATAKERLAEAERAADRTAAEKARLLADAAAEYEEKVRQANQVIAWIEASFQTVATESRSFTSRYNRVRFVNFSYGPIFDVDVVIARDTGQEVDLGRVPVLVQGRDENEPVPQALYSADGVRALIYFRDLAGRRWCRSEDGSLVEVNPQNEPLRPGDGLGEASASGVLPQPQPGDTA